MKKESKVVLVKGEGFTPQELERMKSKVHQVLDGCKRVDNCLGANELRYITSQGVPLIDIMLKSIPMECLEKGINEWFDKFFEGVEL